MGEICAILGHGQLVTHRAARGDTHVTSPLFANAGGVELTATVQLFILAIIGGILSSTNSEANQCEIRRNTHYIPVSYTHLDVYKRQSYNSPESCNIHIIGLMFTLR